jgi:gliding motility-associated-like protein
MLLARHLRCLAFVFLTIVTIHKANAQREAFHWIGANGAHLDFRNYPLKFSTDAAKFEDTTNIFSSVNTTVHSDKNGNLLFYFNGQDFYNYKHEIILGAKDTLKLSQITGVALPVVVPIQGCKFYVFTDQKADANNTNPSLYHVLDMSANNGLGKVLSVNNYIYNPTLHAFRLAATKHKNMIDTWLIANDDQNTFYAYLVDYETGIISPPVISKFDKGYIWFYNGTQFLVSPKGDYITTFFQDRLDMSLHHYRPLLSFDNETGKIKLLHLGYRCNNRITTLAQFSNNGEHLFYDPNCLDMYAKTLKVKLSPDSIQYNTYLQEWTSEYRNYKGIWYTAPTDFSLNGSTAPEGYNIIGETWDLYYGMMTGLNKPITTYFDKSIYFYKIYNDNTPRTRPRQQLPYFNKPNFISNYHHPDWTSRYKKLSTWYGLENTSICIQDSANLLASEVRPHDSLVVHWGDGQKQVYQGNAKHWKHKYAKAGKYQVVFRLYEPCAWDVDTFQLEVLPIPTIKSNPDTAFLCGSQSILAKVQNPTPDFVYSWSNGKKGSEIELKEIGSYTVSASNRCGSVYDTFVVKEGSWNIPNVFTPNGDGINDTWNITSRTTVQANVKILNRWGSVVYESEKYENDWEANNVPDGIYFYQITQNEGCQYKGWVQVLR